MKVPLRLGERVYLSKKQGKVSWPVFAKLDLQ